MFGCEIGFTSPCLQIFLLKRYFFQAFILIPTHRLHCKLSLTCGCGKQSNIFQILSTSTTVCVKTYCTTEHQSFATWLFCIAHITVRVHARLLTFTRASFSQRILCDNLSASPTASIQDCNIPIVGVFFYKL